MNNTQFYIWNKWDNILQTMRKMGVKESILKDHSRHVYRNLTGSNIRITWWF